MDNPTPESKPMTEEELKEKKVRDKRASFESNPDRFVCIDDLAVAIMRTDKGLAKICNPHGRKEAVQVKGECDVMLTRLILEMDLLIEQERRGNIVPSKGAIKQFANRILGR